MMSYDDVFELISTSATSAEDSDFRNCVLAYGHMVYVVRAKSSSLINPPSANKLLNMLERPQSFDITVPAEERHTRTLFRKLVAYGRLKLTVIVTIKNLFPEARELYMRELFHISRNYNGNITFVLVSQDAYAHKHDFPDTFVALQEAIKCMGPDFYTQTTLQITDAGRKLRNFPATLRYGFQGLMPYSTHSAYIHEVLQRAGILLLQLPNFGRSHHVIVPSDGLLNFHSTVLPSEEPLASWRSHNNLLAFLAPVIKRKNLSEKVLALTGKQYEVQCILAKPSADLLEKKQHCYPDGELYTLPFVSVWPKHALLAPFIAELVSQKMQDGRSFLEIPCDFFLIFLESLFTPTDEEWLARRMDTNQSICEADWINVGRIAHRYFGVNGSRTTFVRMNTKNAFIDEGYISLFKLRARSRHRGKLKFFFKTPFAALGGFESFTGDRVVVSGRGKLRVGKNVQIYNTLIDLGDAGEVSIPDGWTIHDSYLGQDNVFTATGGYLTAVFGRNPDNGMIMPASGAKFNGGFASTSVLIQTDSQPLLVAIPLDASSVELDMMRLSRHNWSLSQLQDQVDVISAQRCVQNLSALLASHFYNLSNVFPVDITHANVLRDVEFSAWVGNLSHQVQKAQVRGQRFWVTIEGLQGAGKSFLAMRLCQALRQAGKHVVLLQEDWFHQARPWRERMRLQQPALWRKHRKYWHRWEDARTVIQQLQLQQRGHCHLHHLYNRATGQTDMEKRVTLYEDTIFIYTGFYISDIYNLELPEGLQNRLKVYMGISQDDSLIVKQQRDQWRSRLDIDAIDREVYRPAFRQYLMLFDPASSADVVARINIHNRSVMEIVQPK